MKKIALLCSLVILCSAIAAAPVKNSRPWEYSRTISDVKIYQRPGTTPGIFEFMAITTLNVSPDSIQKIVMDIPNNQHWMADCVHSEYITKTESGDIIAYYITAPPWPVSRRDSVIKIKSETLSGRTVFTMSSLPEGEAEKYKAVNPDYVRIHIMEGEVILNEISKGQTEVKFSAAGESGGDVPHFIVKMGGWVIPFKTLTGLKKYSLL
jgi:tellurite resistance-related uncharacterized protein